MKPIPGIPSASDAPRMPNYPNQGGRTGFMMDGPAVAAYLAGARDLPRRGNKNNRDIPGSICTLPNIKW
jgi:hypothetical protein